MFRQSNRRFYPETVENPRSPCQGERGQGVSASASTIAAQTPMTVRIGFAGTGGIAGAHLINLVRIPDADVVALYDVDKERCELAMRRTYGQQDQLVRPGTPEPRKLKAKVYTDLKAMLSEA